METNNKKAEETLKQIEEKFQSYFNTSLRKEILEQIPEIENVMKNFFLAGFKEGFLLASEAETKRLKELFPFILRNKG